MSRLTWANGNVQRFILDAARQFTLPAEPGAVGWIATADEQTQIEWEYANEIRRDHAAITGSASALGVTDAQLDALFEAAMAL